MDFSEKYEQQEAILDRLKRWLSVENEKEIGSILGIKPSNFSGLKNRGSLVKNIADWAITQKVDLEWLLRGKGEPYLNQSTGSDHDNQIRETTSNYEVKTDAILPVVDTALLQEVIELVERLLLKHEMIMDPPAKSEAISIMYEMYLDSGKKPEERTTERMLRLVA